MIILLQIIVVLALNYEEYSVIILSVQRAINEVSFLSQSLTLGPLFTQRCKAMRLVRYYRHSTIGNLKQVK